MNADELAERLNEAVNESRQYHTCMALHASRDGLSVDLLLDTGSNSYSEWIPGEGGDICLYRDRQTNKVVGCHLPLYNERLMVHYDGPIRINAGFRRYECE